MSTGMVYDALEYFLEALAVDTRHRSAVDRYLGASLALVMLDNGRGALRILGDARISEAGLLVLEAGLKESRPEELAMLFRARLSYSMPQVEADKWLKVWLYLYPDHEMAEELISRVEIRLSAEDMAWFLMLKGDFNALVAHLTKGGVPGSRLRKALVQGDKLRDFDDALEYISGRSAFEMILAREYSARLGRQMDFLPQEREIYAANGEKYLLAALDFLRHVHSPSDETMEAMMSLAKKDRWGRLAALMTALNIAAQKGEDRALIRIYRELAGAVRSDALKGAFALRAGILAFENGKVHDGEELLMLAIEKDVEAFLAKRYLFYLYLHSRSTDQLLAMDTGEDSYLSGVLSFLSQVKASDEKRCASSACVALKEVLEVMEHSAEKALDLIHQKVRYDSMVVDFMESLLLLMAERWEEGLKKLRSVNAQFTSKEASRGFALYCSRLFIELGKRRHGAEFLREYFLTGGQAPRSDGSGFPWLEVMLDMPDPDPEWFSPLRDELAQLRGKYESEREGGLLARILTIETHFVEDRTEKVDLLLKAAKIHEEITGDVQEAVRNYLKVMKLDEKNRKALESLSRIYETMEAWEDLLDVTQHMIALTEEPNQLANLYFRYGSILEAQFGREDDALVYYRKAWKVSKHSLPALHGMREIYKRREDWEHVLKTLELEASVWEDPKEKAGIYVQIGNIWKEHFSDYSKAERFYEAARKLNPSSRAVIKALFEMYSEQEEWDKGVELVSSLDRHALREGLPEERARLHMMRGKAFLYQKETMDAAEAFMNAIQLYPQLLEPMEELVELSLSMEDGVYISPLLDECEEIYISKGPKEGIALVKLARGNMALAEGRIEEALARYREAHEMCPCLPAVYRYYARLLLDMNRMEEIHSLWDNFRETCPPEDDNVATYVLMADYMNGPLDMHREAVRVLRSTLAKLPNNTQLLMALCRILLSQRMPREVMAIGERLIGTPGLSSKDKFSVLFYMGLASHALGRDEEALAFLGDAADIDPEDIYVLLHMAYIHARRGSYEDAFSVLGGCESPECVMAQAVMEVWAGRPIDAEAWLRSLTNDFPPPEDDVLESALRLLVDVKDMMASEPSSDEMEFILERLVKVAPDDIDVLQRYMQVLPSGSPRWKRVRETIALLREEDHSTVPTLPPSGALANEQLRLAIGTHDPTGLEAQLWVTLKDVLEDFYSPPLPDIARPAGQTELIVWEEMIRLFKFDGELWVGTPVAGRVMVLPGDPPRFLVDPGLFDLPLPAIRFVLARAVESSKSHYGLLFSLSIRELRALLNTLNELRRPANTWSESLSKIVESLDRRQSKALKRILLSADEELSSLDFRRHILGMEKALDRMGLLASGDFASTMRAMQFISSAIDGSKFSALQCYYIVPRARELLGVYLSSEWDEYLDKMNPSGGSGGSDMPPSEEDMPTAVL